MRIKSAVGSALHWISPSAEQAAKRLWARIHPPFWNKAHIINHLAEVFGYRHYLELCTPISGGRYGEIDRSKFASCVRLMYRCPEEYVPADGLPIDYRTVGTDISECLSRMREDGRSVDIALIDSFHEYELSLRDLGESFQLISDGGTLVVHDCLPETVEHARPNFIEGEWCGLTYQAFIDFVNNRDDLSFYTVNTDFGCGIIHKQSLLPADARASIDHTGANDRAQILKNWKPIRDDPWAAFSFFEAHKHTLLNMISIEVFRTKNPKRRHGLGYFMKMCISI